MSNKSTLFYRENTSIILDFSAEEISSDGAIILLEKIERKEKLIDYFSKYLPDNRDPLRIKHSRYKLLKQCVFMLMQGYQDPTYGKQQFTIFNGYYGQFMYNELFSHDGHTGQIIVPVLRPGNSHSNKWYVSILKRIVKKIRAAYPKMKITIRADSGFSNAPFYKLADDESLFYDVGLATNQRLKKRDEASENRIKEVKNMCFSYRLSNHGFWANFFRLLISSIAYEIFLVIKSKIKKTSFKKLKKET